MKNISLHLLDIFILQRTIREMLMEQFISNENKNPLSPCISFLLNVRVCMCVGTWVCVHVRGYWVCARVRGGGCACVFDCVHDCSSLFFCTHLVLRFSFFSLSMNVCLCIKERCVLFLSISVFLVLCVSLNVFQYIFLCEYFSFLSISFLSFSLRELVYLQVSFSYLKDSQSLALIFFVSFLSIYLALSLNTCVFVSLIRFFQSSALSCCLYISLRALKAQLFLPHLTPSQSFENY